MWRTRTKRAGPSAPSSGGDHDPASGRGRPGGNYALAPVVIVAVLVIAALGWVATQNGEGATVVRALVRQIVRALF